MAEIRDGLILGTPPPRDERIARVFEMWRLGIVSGQQRDEMVHRAQKGQA